jgi:ornithine decarboxylase
MNNLRFRSAVSPLRRRFPAAQQALLPTVDALVERERPEEPMHCLRPAAITAAARDFVAGFPGTVMYAVKCNPEPAVLRALHRGGVTHFDCASINEVALVRQMFPEAAIHFMHPVKARGAIREAWARHGVRDFVLDDSARPPRRRRRCCARPARMPLGSGCRSMSARNASTRWPGVPPSGSPAR